MRDNRYWNGKLLRIVAVQALSFRRGVVFFGQVIPLLLYIGSFRLESFVSFFFFFFLFLRYLVRFMY